MTTRVRIEICEGDNLVTAIKWLMEIERRLEGALAQASQAERVDLQRDLAAVREGTQIVRHLLSERP